MIKHLISLLSLLSFFLVLNAQVQTGENIAIANTESGKVCSYISNNEPCMD